MPDAGETSTAASGVETALSGEEARKVAFEESTGIDSELAFLDPSLQVGVAGGGGSGGDLYRAVGAFDASKGRFVPAASRTAGGTFDPTRMTFAAQAERQMEAFFDTDQWRADAEKRRREEEEAGEEKRRKVTKEDIKRFQQKKKEKKAARYGWLRD